MELTNAPLQYRLKNYFLELNPHITDDIDKYIKIKLYTFIDINTPCDVCKQSIEIINNWLTKNDLLETLLVGWIVEPEMSRNILSMDYNIKQSPTHIITDSKYRVIDIKTGIIAEHWLDEYIMPTIKG